MKSVRTPFNRRWRSQQTSSMLSVQQSKKPISISLVSFRKLPINIVIQVSVMRWRFRWSAFMFVCLLKVIRKMYLKWLISNNMRIKRLFIIVRSNRIGERAERKCGMLVNALNQTINRVFSWNVHWKLYCFVIDFLFSLATVFG